VKHLLIANRGEIAVRIARAAASLGIRTTALFARDDAIRAHARATDDSRALPGRGARAFLDRAAILAIARETGCDAVHPGYGFLSEDATFAAALEAASLIFVGPAPATLELFGDKGRARAFAASCGVPIVPGTATGDATLAEIAAFAAAAGAPIVIKARSGGGGRGMRVVRALAEVDDAYARCRSEAAAAFGDGAVYAEALLTDVRHVEVQLAGDGGGPVVVLGDRDCSVQRRFQKLVEIAPAPALAAPLRRELAESARRLGVASRLRGLATVEFLVTRDDALPFAFIETNARLQVEHTVTEEVTGLDLVRLQLEIAGGKSLAACAVAEDAVSLGTAVQVRLSAERLAPSGELRPSTGTLAHFDLPGGPGVRVDTHLRAGDAVDASYDSLLAKIVVLARDGSPEDAFAKLRRALGETAVAGVETNLALLRGLAARRELADGAATTSFFDAVLAELPGAACVAAAGARDEAPAEPGVAYVTAPVAGRVVSIDVAPGAAVRRGATIAVLDSMKMEHVVAAPASGIVRLLGAAPGDAVAEGRRLATLEVTELEDGAASLPETVDPAAIRADLARVRARQAATLDAARPEAIAKRHAAGGRSARENVADLCDAGTFVEYGALALPAQRRRRSLDELIARYPGDGMVTGVGDVNGARFPGDRARCAVLAYDYTVLAGTQGAFNHAKTDRLLELAERHAWPVVLYAEGGGGRPGDTDVLGVAGLDLTTFARYAGLAGKVPRVGIAAGRCFAGNAALFGCSDVTIATANASIGMGGPAMIEGGGLGIVAPEAVGPLAMQVPSGVVDLAVRDEAEATVMAKKYLSYFQGPLAEYTCADQRELRAVVPARRLRAYDVRRAIELLADVGEQLELRAGFGRAIVTSLARVEGRPIGIVANDPRHLGGAIDADGADKAARFLQLCDAFGLPVLFLCDCPGFMVGPEAEATGLVRHASRLFLAGARLRVPCFTIVLRKGYGLGAMASAGGGFHAGVFTVGWPTAEFGAMGLEGAVRLGFKTELDATVDPAERKRRFEAMVAEAYAHGRAENMASFLEIDDVIDPADSRRWIVHGLRAPRAGTERRDRFVDAW